MAIITISRGTLSGGQALAEQLSARLGCKVISREVIVEAAKTYGVSEDALLKGMKSPPGLWARLTHQRDRYLLAVQATLADMIQDGNVVYHGLAGPLLLADLSRVVKVRLIAPYEHRLRSAMIELGINREEAAHHIETIDQQRAKWIHALYGAEWTDAELYDLVVNLGQMSMETATELIVDLAGRRDYSSTPRSKQALKDFALTTRVRAALAFQSSFSDSSVTVSAHEGVVLLSGGDQFKKHRDEVLSFVRSVDGVSRVRVEGEEPRSDGGKSPATPGEKTAADVMLPIGSYPHIPQSLSIRDAITALSTSSVKLADGHVISPRFLLVHDEMHRLIGVIARRNLLRGLLPEHRLLERTKQKIESMAINVDIDLSFPETCNWISLFSSQAIANGKEPVQSIMSPIRCTVREDDDLSIVVTTMIFNAVDLLPVIKGTKAVGVILMTDVFDTVAEFFMEAEA